MIATAHTNSTNGTIITGIIMIALSSESKKKNLTFETTKENIAKIIVKLCNKLIHLFQKNIQKVKTNNINYLNHHIYK